MDFVALAAAFEAEVVWSDAGKVRAPQCFTLRRGEAEIRVSPELEEGDCAAALFEVERAGARVLPRIVLRREGALDRGGKAIGVNREVQLGDAVFDAEVYVESEAPDATIRETLADPAARAAAAALLRAVDGEVVLGGDRVAARLTAAQLADPRGPAVSAALAELAALARAVGTPTSVPSPAEVMRRRGVAHVVGMAAAWLVLLALAIFVRPPPTLAWGSVGAALALGVGLWLVCCAGLAAALRGGADSLRWLVISAGFFGLVAPFAGMRLALAGNARLDDAPAAAMAATVVEVGEAGALIGADADPSALVHVPRDRLFGDPPAGARVTLRVRPGALGWAWVERVDG